MRVSVGKLEHASVAPQTRFQALVGPHVARLVRFACRRVGNPADAEDVVQEACTRAWIGFADLRDEALVLPWLYRILRSAVSDFHERQSRREQLAPTLTLESATEVAGEQGDGPLEELIASASSEQIRELLRTLPEDFALAIELHDLEGLRYCDIAEMTGVPMGTVMSRIYRGRKLLAALIVMNENLFDLITLRPGPEDQLNKRRA
jgi:RNA polymerase sigma-70 factor (ECF subfamily)